MRLPLICLFASALLSGGCTSLPAPTDAYSRPEELGQIQHPELDELSGLTPSRRQSGVYWTHNDSGDRARIFGIDATGRYLGSVEIDGVTALDWEDIASFTLDGKAWLMIADTGDNFAIRPVVTLHFLPEPDPATLDPERPLHLRPSLSWNLTFPEGPRDCEGVTVSTRTREVLLLSKRTEPPVLYSLPLNLEPMTSAKTLVARRVTPLPGILPPTAAERALPGRTGQYRSQVTAFDLSDDGSLAAVLTYGNIWLYRINGDDSWTGTFTREPDRIPVQGLMQAEALCFAPGTHDLILTSERLPAPLQRYRARQ